MKIILLKWFVKCNECFRKWCFFWFFRFYGFILLMLYSFFGKEIKINRVIKSKDNIFVFFLYIWLFFIIVDICMWKVYFVVKGFFFFVFIIRYEKVELIYFFFFRRNMGYCIFLYLKGVRICEYYLGLIEKRFSFVFGCMGYLG